MTYWENKTTMFAIDGLKVISAIGKNKMKFETRDYETIDWETLTEISRKKFMARHSEVKEYINELNEKFNQ